MKLLTFFLALLLTVPVFAQRAKPRTDEMPATVITDGIVYALPRTGIRVTVKARQNVFVPGPYAQFAEQLLGIRDARQQPYTLWEMGNIEITTFSEPDPAEVYKATGNVAALVQLTPSGCLAAIDAKPGSLKLPEVVTGSYVQKNPAAKISFHNLSDSPFFAAPDSLNRGRAVRFSLEQKAAQTATRILQARATRYETAAGLLDEFHPDGDAYKASFNELRNIEEEYLSLFVGKTKSEEYEFSFDYIPSAKPAKGEVIFRFDETRGFLPRTDLSGKPVMLDFDRDEALASSLNRASGSASSAANLYYRQPGVAEVRLVRELAVVAAARLTIAQFGNVAPIPDGLLDGFHSIEFHPETGAIKSISKD